MPDSKRDSDATLAGTPTKDDEELEALELDELDDVFAPDPPEHGEQAAHAEHEDHHERRDGHELAPLPVFNKPQRSASINVASAARGNPNPPRLGRTSSFSSTGDDERGTVRSRRPRQSQTRPRAFSAGAGSGAIPTIGGEEPTSRPITPPNGLAHAHQPPLFHGASALGRSASRVSTMSNHTFADAASLVNLGLARVETRGRRRAGTVTSVGGGPLGRVLTALSVAEKDEKEYPEEVEELVAVEVLDDGEEIEYPDGGMEAWLVLIGGWCAAVCAFGLAGSVGAFQVYYQAELLTGYSSSEVAWIGSTQAAVCFFSCVFTGPLFDRYGCRPLLAAGTVLLTLAFILLSFCTQFYQIFLCHATLMAMGMDLMFIVPMGAVGQWFFLRRGLAFGVLMTGSSAGAIVWPAIVANLPARIGFGWTVRVIALLVAVLGSISALLVRTRLPPRPPGKLFRFDEFRNPRYACVAFSFPCLVFGFFSFLTFIGSYGRLVGLGTLAPYLLMITNGASGFGRVFSGLAADRVGTFNVAIMGMAAMVVLMFAWLAMKTAGALIVLCVLYGFVSGAPVALQGPMVTASARDPSQAGTLIGMALMVQSFAQLCGPPIFGAIVGAGSDAEQLARFPHAIAFGGSMLAVATGLLVATRMMKDRKLLAAV